MPKQRPPFDTERYESLKTQGLSQRAIAQEMGMPEATLRNNLKVMAQAVAQAVGKSLPLGDQGVPCKESLDVHQGRPKVSQEGTPEGDSSRPPLYVHPGIPDDSQESPVGNEDIAEVHQGIPALPAIGLQEGRQGLPIEALSPQLAEALTAAWPDLLQILAWWRDRQQTINEPPEKLERVTYHVRPKWIEAVRREADITGDSYAAVVNRALATYFRGKSA
jgi:hypothetical protein